MEKRKACCVSQIALVNHAARVRTAKPLRGVAGVRAQAVERRYSRRIGRAHFNRQGGEIDRIVVAKMPLHGPQQQLR